MPYGKIELVLQLEIFLMLALLTTIYGLYFSHQHTRFSSAARPY